MVFHLGPTFGWGRKWRGSCNKEPANEAAISVLLLVDEVVLGFVPSKNRMRHDSECDTMPMVLFLVYQG